MNIHPQLKQDVIQIETGYAKKESYSLSNYKHVFDHPLCEI